jgi:hypothetical protein
MTTAGFAKLHAGRMLGGSSTTSMQRILRRLQPVLWRGLVLSTGSKTRFAVGSAKSGGRSARLAPPRSSRNFGHGWKRCCDRSPLSRRQRKLSAMRSRAGVPSPATSMTAASRSIIQPQSGHCVPSLLAERNLFCGSDGGGESAAAIHYSGRRSSTELIPNCGCGKCLLASLNVSPQSDRGPAALESRRQSPAPHSLTPLGSSSRSVHLTNKWTPLNLIRPSGDGSAGCIDGKVIVIQRKNSRERTKYNAAIRGLKLEGCRRLRLVNSQRQARAAE